MAKRKKKTGTQRKKKTTKKKVAKQVANSSRKRKVSHKGARAKGLQFERDVANAIGHVFPEAKRHLEYQGDSAQEGRDISNTGVYAIQCKNLQNYVPIKTIKEVNRTSENRPVLVTKGNKMEPVVVMYFSDWVKMLEETRGRELAESEVRQAGKNLALGIGYDGMAIPEVIEDPKESAGMKFI